MEQVDVGGFRSTPLYYKELVGQFFLTEKLVADTTNVLSLTQFTENLVFWGGFESNGCTFFTTLIIPNVDATSQSVFVDAKEMGIINKQSRQNGVSILAQVHSHPGSYSYHSDGDDNLILFPYNGMLSLIVPYYSQKAKSLSDFSIHQMHGGRWYLAPKYSVEKNIHVVPTEIKTRTN